MQNLPVDDKRKMNKGGKKKVTEKEMRSKEVGDIYQLHITAASGTPAHSGNASVVSNSLLSVLR